MVTELNMMIMRFIERKMEEHMHMVIANYEIEDYKNAHLYMERTCIYGNARKVLLNGGTKEDIKNLAKKYFSVVGKTHVWYAYNAVYEEMNDIEQFIKCGLYKTNAEREAENPQWIPCSERLPDKKESVYWVCLDNGNQCQCRWTNNRYGLGANEWSEWGWHVMDKPQYEQVIAWMPLPKPAKFE